MASFDDILNQPAVQPKPPVQEKPQRKREWWQVKEERQRKEAYVALDRIFTELSEGKGDVQGYLDTHGRFDRYSARNALLIHDKCPSAAQIGDYRYWEKQSAEILKTEKNNPIVILEPGDRYKRRDGTMGQNYYAKEVYDISQTSARGQEPPRVSWDDRLLLKALIHRSPVSLRVVEQVSKSGRGALYSPEQNAILVKKGMDAPDIFRCVSLELAKVELAALHQGETRDTAGYQAFCVSYMLCKKYGVDTQSYDTSHLHEIFMGKEPDTIKSELKDMENVMGNINSRMARVLYPEREKNRAEQERGGREKW